MEDKSFKQRANSAYSFSIKDGKLVWDFGSIGVLRFDPDKASAVNRHRAIAHGFKQRIIDAGALDADANGKVSPSDKYEQMKRVVEHLESGSTDWNLKPTVGTTGPASYVTKALVALGTYQGTDVSTTELANAFVQRVSKIEKLNLKGEMGKARDWLEKSSKQIRDKIAELRAAETPAVDADAELAALMGQGDE
jgi:uncharacterized FAD-dependent dehydrogenase